MLSNTIKGYVHSNEHIISTVIHDVYLTRIHLYG